MLPSELTNTIEQFIVYVHFTYINTLPAKDRDLRLSASNACLLKTEISVSVTECVFFTSTCYKLHVHIARCAIQLERRNVPHHVGI